MLSKSVTIDVPQCPGEAPKYPVPAVFENIQFRHFRHQVGKREFAVTVCYAQVPGDGEVLCGIALAFCCPRDQFCKAMGRNISAGRLGSAWSLLTRTEKQVEDDVYQEKTRFARWMSYPAGDGDLPRLEEILWTRLHDFTKGPPWWTHIMKAEVDARLTATAGEPPA